MKKTDKLVQLLNSHIEDKDILEVACGGAEFSISASTMAKSVSCIDLDDSRLNELINHTDIKFQIMDASKMDYPDDSFDTIVIYNAFYHIQSQWEDIARECSRVLRKDGKICIASTWKLDIGLMKDYFGNDVKWEDEFLIVMM